MFNLIIAVFLMISHCFCASCVSIDITPITLIRADDSSGLDRPEGVAFSPSGDFIAVTNSLANTVTFYRRVGNQGAIYEKTPAFSIKGPKSQLNYPHDLSFSPDGQSLAVANRGGNAITIYRKNPFQDYYDSIPIAIIGGKKSKIMAPDAVRYSPVENTIAVVNMVTNTITFYYYQGDQYQQKPYQIIQNPILQIPDGLDFSKDGKFLAVTSHDAHAVAIYQRINNSQGYYTQDPVQILQGKETGFSYPHSLSFHPLNNCLAVSCSQGSKNVHVFTKISEATPYSNAPDISLEVIEMYDASTLVFLDQLQQEGGVKGVAFSPDGKSLAITQNLCQDDLHLPYPVGVLAIYSLNDE